MSSRIYNDGYLYVYYFDNDRIVNNNKEWPCKIGVSRNMAEARVFVQNKTHHTAPVIGFEYFCEFPFKLETFIHKKLSNKKISGEWYNTNISEIREICNDYISMSINTISMMDISSVIRIARKKRGMSQSELGAKAGLRQETISLIEGGNDCVRIKTLQKIFTALDLAVSIYPIE
jgi:HTH-type transcriptional regulator/antitoxin HipB